MKAVIFELFQHVHFLHKLQITIRHNKTCKYKFYSLLAIIVVGYRINSRRDTQFRMWATIALGIFAKQGYVQDKMSILLRIIFQ